MTAQPRLYVAGPLFDEGERWFQERLDALAVECGYETFLPHRDNVRPWRSTHKAFRQERRI